MTWTRCTESALSLFVPTSAEPSFDHSITSERRGSSPSPLFVSMKPYFSFWLPSWG